MKRTARVLFTVVACLCMVPAFAYAKFASYSNMETYLSWGGAQALYQSIESTSSTQTTPHGGYAENSVKCNVCHSLHRATSYTNISTGETRTAAGVGVDTTLLNSGNTCTACHAAWGATPTTAIVEVGRTSSGPHIGAGGSSCSTVGCHGSVHGIGASSAYAMVRKYNLTNSASNIDTQITAAIAAGNYVKASGSSDARTTVNTTDGTPAPIIGTKSLDQAMRAYVTGYVCYPCHGSASRSVASADFSAVTTTTASVTGHLSTGDATQKWIPTCDGCHDVIGVATDTTAWPHADRGIAVYYGRFNQNTQSADTSTTEIATDNTDATRYGLWMTSGNYGDNANAVPIAGKVANSLADFNDATESSGSTASKNIAAILNDGACIKCHQTSELR